MTLQNGLVHGKATYLWADTAYWNSETGEMVGHETKVFFGSDWPYAGSFSCTGGNPHYMSLSVLDAKPSNISELIEATRSALHEYCANGGHGRLLVASFDGNSRLHLVASDDVGFAKPYEPVEMDLYTSSGNASQAFKMADKAGWNPKRMGKVINAQIKEPIELQRPIHCAGEKSWIGGNIEQYKVARAGVKSRIVRWGV